MPKVVVTGLGLVTAIGSNVEESWGAMLNAQDGTTEITSFDTSRYKVHRACELKGLNSNNDRGTKNRHTVYDCLSAATKEALQDSGILDYRGLERNKIGISVGTLAGELSAFEHRLRDHPDSKASGFSMDVVLSYPPMTLSTQLAEDFQIEGPNVILINACSSGNHAMCWAFDMLQDQKVDAMIVGGSDVVPQTEFTHFHNLKALAPEKCQPFDKNRQGLVVGAGAGVLILETLEHAKKRGANIYAEIKGYGLSSDGFHMTAPHPKGEGAIRAMEIALDNSKLSYKDINYISAHGTGTPLNDKMETLALKTVFKERAQDTPCSSVKSMIGHTMGAASAIESVVCCLSIRTGKIPPTINYETKDPECDLDCVPNEARSKEVKFALNNSFAFGGNNASIVFGRV
ncbi:MAG TPA: beta-ketoacyl-[acyl-carrier-protein] synthase family protein [Candidatus Avalokitesvara rifleensis]|uniref:beta-ketoacyl-[acyl-carrier-protein] synthase family protein n=1 Tax=Candidatus Avalokitesvara rifleensis TaxID=3367620 RepID=UPI002713EBD9|nr:beta-ketoacyl-[acyl-carrier-protein] synthase family protein [Candidatus Brocadiales bacterium]